MNRTAQIIAHLEKGKKLTPLDAMNQFGCFRLAARIHDLRQIGYAIKTERFKTPLGAVVARYFLA